MLLGMELISNMLRYRAKMMIRRWLYSNKKSALKNLDYGLGPDYGFIYAARIDVAQGFTLLKIGATRSPNSRLRNFGRKASLFCVSPPHVNFFENEEVLHQFFAKYRVPARPHQGAQAEFFNLSMPYFLEHLPMLTYEQEK